MRRSPLSRSGLRLVRVAALLLAGSAAPAEAAKRLRTYVSCGVSDSTYTTPPSHSCRSVTSRRR